MKTAIALLLALAFTGCASIKNAPETIGNGKWDGPLPPKAVWSVAESQYPWLKMVRPMVYGQQDADPFEKVPATFTEWVDAKGQPVAFPITRTAVKTVTETMGATTPPAIPAPVPLAQPTPPVAKPDQPTQPIIASPAPPASLEDALKVISEAGK